MHGILITNLPKAFESTVSYVHRVLIAKLKTCRLNIRTGKFVRSYFTGSLGMHVGGCRGDWLVLSEGTPQHIILRLFIFNMFINDFVCKILLPQVLFFNHNIYRRTVLWSLKIG